MDEPVGITPLYSLQNDFEQYSFNRLISGSVKFKDGEGIVYVSSMHLLKYVKYYFYVALFVSLLIFFLPTFIFIKRKVKYINILKQEVLNMSQGDLSHAMTIMSHDELAILAQEMDTLRITLASNYQNEARIKEAHQEMITCLSHDLRTPLTALRGYLDILCLHCYKDEKQMDHYLNSCIEKTEQIKDLSNKTFEYSLVYNDDLIPSLETISSESFIQYIEEHLEYLELEGFKIEKEITISSVQLQLDLSMMKRMMDNICSNIQKYARKEQPIYLQISIEKGNIKIVFENEKKEINQKDIEDADKAVENFLNNFLNKISSNIEYTVKNENGLVYVNIKGEDSTRLIGYRGEALNALQTLLTTVASKNREESVKVILDIGNYKDARKKTLEELARKVEKTVKKTGKSVTLEPMNAYERKILHTELQNSEFVKTYSVGEGDRRRVVIAKK